MASEPSQNIQATSPLARAALVLGIASVVLFLAALALEALVFGLLAVFMPFLTMIVGLRAWIDIASSKNSMKGRSLICLGVAVGALPVGFVCLRSLIPQAHENAILEGSRSNLKQIGEAIQIYHDTHHHLPPVAIAGKAGQPLLSWRVKLLPYLGEYELYKRFHLDEPWDSPHNLQMLPLIPTVYQTFGAKDASTTRLQAVVGQGTIFGEAEPLTFSQISQADGTGNTLMVVEANEPVPWTKPAEWEYRPNGPLQPLARVKGLRKAKFLGLCADGQVILLPLPEKDELLVRGMATWNGGEELKLP